MQRTARGLRFSQLERASHLEASLPGCECVVLGRAESLPSGQSQRGGSVAVVALREVRVQPRRAV